MFWVNKVETLAKKSRLCYSCNLKACHKRNSKQHNHQNHRKRKRRNKEKDLHPKTFSRISKLLICKIIQVRSMLRKNLWTKTEKRKLTLSRNAKLKGKSTILASTRFSQSLLSSLGHHLEMLRKVNM